MKRFGLLRATAAAGFLAFLLAGCATPTPEHQESLPRAGPVAAELDVGDADVVNGGVDIRHVLPLQYVCNVPGDLLLVGHAEISDDRPGSHEGHATLAAYSLANGTLFPLVRQTTSNLSVADGQHREKTDLRLQIPAPPNGAIVAVHMGGDAPGQPNGSAVFGGTRPWHASAWSLLVGACTPPAGGPGGIQQCRHGLDLRESNTSFGAPPVDYIRPADPAGSVCFLGPLTWEGSYAQMEYVSAVLAGVAGAEDAEPADIYYPPGLLGNGFPCGAIFMGGGNSPKGYANLTANMANRSAFRWERIPPAQGKPDMLALHAPMTVDSVGVNATITWTSWGRINVEAGVFHGPLVDRAVDEEVAKLAAAVGERWRPDPATTNPGAGPMTSSRWTTAYGC